MIQFTVVGTPIPKGSHKAQGKTKHGFTRITNANPKTKSWEEQIAWAYKLKSNRPEPMRGPVSVTAKFHMPRPKSRKNDIFPTGKPDSDKLERALYDALTLAGVYVDDAQIVNNHSFKVFAGGYRSKMDEPGVTIEIFAWGGEDEGWI